MLPEDWLSAAKPQTLAEDRVSVQEKRKIQRSFTQSHSYSGCAGPRGSAAPTATALQKHTTETQSDCSWFGSFHGPAWPSAHGCRHENRDPSLPLLRTPAQPLSQPQEVPCHPPHSGPGFSPAPYPAVSGRQEEPPLHGSAGARPAFGRFTHRQWVDARPLPDPSFAANLTFCCALQAQQMEWKRQAAAVALVIGMVGFTVGHHSYLTYCMSIVAKCMCERLLPQYVFVRLCCRSSQQHCILLRRQPDMRGLTGITLSPMM